MGDYLIDLRQLRDFRTVQHAQCQADHLQILTSSRCRDIARLCPHIVDNRPLQPWDQEVRALVLDLLLHTSHPIEDDSTSTAPDIIDGSVEEQHTGCGRASQPVKVVEGVGHGFGGWRSKLIGDRWMMSGFSWPDRV